MIKISKLVSATILSGLASISFASAAPDLTSSTAKNSAHIGIDLGYAGVQSPNTEVYSASDITNGNASYKIGNFAYGLNVGYDFALNDNWLLGPEVGYYNLGYSQYRGYQNGVFSDNTKVRSSAVNALARLTYMTNDGFNVFAKAGAAYVMQKTNSVVGYLSTPASSSHTQNAVKPEGDLGLGYQFANGLGLSADYQHIFASSESKSHFQTSANRAHTVYSTNAIYGEISYRFGR